MPTTNLEQLTLATVPTLDPTIDAVFRKIMQGLVSDCERRPGDKKARECKLTFKLTPKVDPNTGELDYIQFEVEGKGNIPIYRTRTRQVVADRGIAMFSRGVPGDDDEAPLFQEDDDE